MRIKLKELKELIERLIKRRNLITESSNEEEITDEDVKSEISAVAGGAISGFTAPQEKQKYKNK